MASRKGYDSRFRSLPATLALNRRSNRWLALALLITVNFAVSRWVLTSSSAAPVAINPVAVVTVPAASFELNTPVGPDEIVSAFGTQLATQFAVASTVPLPTALGGTTVTVNGRPAGLMFVSAGQINFVLPANTEIGVANVMVSAGDGTISNGTVQVKSAAPALFTASSDGNGVPVAVVRRFRNNQEVFPSVLAAQLNTQSQYIPLPIDLGPTTDLVILELYLSGIRHAPDPNGDGNAIESVHVVLGGVDITPLYAGAAPGFAGLDQIDAVIPRSLIGRGKINLSVTVTGAASSKVLEVEIAAATGNAPPQVNSFSPAAALAGQTLVINGNGFSSNLTDNLVRVGGVEARITSATATQLSVVVPFGAKGGAVSVRTTQGEGASAGQIALRTSISGFIENTARQPLSGITVRLVGTGTTAKTGVEGAFILPDVVSGAAVIEIDGTTIQTTPPFPKISLKAVVEANRDNQFARPISLQQATGADLNVGTPNGFAARASRMASASAPTDADAVQSNNITFDVQAGTSASFADGSTSGTVTLTQVENSRTPVNLPPGFFSSTIAQITPFKTILTPGGKLTFPNTDGLPAGAQVTLFRFDQTTISPTLGSFITAGVATVSADGQRIETAQGAITEMGYYFVSSAGQTTTVIGRVVDSDGTTPVRQALVRARGQEAFTDGNGAFIVRNVQVNQGDQISVEASFLRPSGRVDRTQRSGIAVVVNGVTNVAPDLVLPSEVSNRPPVITGPTNLSVNEGATQDVNFVAADPDAGQTIQLGVSGANFASIISRGNDLYTLHLATKVNDAGKYTLSLVATDNQGTGTVQNISLRVNRPPVASVQSVITDENVSKTITLTGNDPDGDPINFLIVSNPAHGSLNGTLPNLTYKPTTNYSGTDSFTFKVNDGLADSNVATVSIFVNFVNSPPTLTVPGPQALNDSQNLSFTVTASDIDVGQTLTFTATGLPGGAAFTPLNATSARFTWTPNSTQTGSYTVSFKVSDNGAPVLNDSKTVTIAVVGQWSTMGGIEGGKVNTLLSSGASLFAGTRGGGVFRSIDNGQSWTASNSGLTNLFVNVLASSGAGIFAGTDGGGIFRSTDNGQTWIAVNSGLPNSYIFSFAVSGSTLLAGTYDGIFRSTDNGQTWIASNSGLPPDPFISSFAVSSSTLFVGTDHGVFRSTDNGQTWTDSNTGLPSNADISTFAISNNSLFAGTIGNGLFMSLNNGTSWTAVTSLPVREAQTSIVVGTNIFMVTEAGLYRSTDNGQSWALVNTGLDCFPEAFASTGTSLFAGTNCGVYLTTNNGQSWALARVGITAVDINAVVANGSNLYAIAAGDIYSSNNNGQSWSTSVGSQPISTVYSIVFSNGTLFAGIFGNVYSSTDGGQTWMMGVGLPPKLNVYTLTAIGTELYAGPDGNGVYRSTDNGQTWTAINAGIANLSVTSIAKNGTTLFVGTYGNGVYRSTDNGQTWTAVNTGLTNQTILSLTVSGANIIAGTGDSGIYRSTNNGSSWTNVSTGVLVNSYVNAFAQSGSSLFAATDKGLFISLNQGQSWAAVSAGLPNTGITSIAVNGTGLYAGTVGNGVFRSTY